jgi:uncharacterized protein (TIGR00730 family)
MHRICVFAGSNAGIRPEYRQAARQLGQALVERGIGMVYGGASVGLMGTIADEMRARGGEVIGVLPKGLFVREVAHADLSELREVGTMHERKALMADLADGFIALPGGYGTFDELFEITTWAQIGLHKKPIGLLNVEGYFTPLLALVTHATTEGFIRPFHARLLLYKETPGELLDAFATFQPPDDDETKWSDLPPER